MLLPEYKNAAVRNVTPVCPVRQRLGLGIDMPDGTVLRLALDKASVALLRSALDDHSKSFADTQLPGVAHA